VYQWRVDRGGGEYASLKPLQVLTFDLARSAGGIAAQLQQNQQNQRLIASPITLCVPVLCPEVEP